MSSDNKNRISERTTKRRKYNSVVDGLYHPTEQAERHMRHRPYGEKKDERSIQK